MATETTTCTYCGLSDGFKRVETCYIAGKPIAAHMACWSATMKAAERVGFNDSPITVEVVSFKHGPREARRLGGTFDSGSKTWQIPAGTVSVSDLPRLGLRLVSAGRQHNHADCLRGVNCQHGTREQGCPLHGELGC